MDILGAEIHRISGGDILERVSTIFGDDLRALCLGDACCVKEAIHLQSGDDVRIEIERTVVNRVKRIIENRVWILQIRMLAVRLDNDQANESGAELHHGIGDAVEPVLSQRVHRLLHGAELIRRILIEDRDAFGEIFRAGNKGLDLMRIDAGVRVCLLCRLEHHLLKREMLRARSCGHDADPDDRNTFVHKTAVSDLEFRVPPLRSQRLTQRISATLR